MRLDPAIAALRSDRAPQARAQAALIAACQAWRGEPGMEQALAELDQFGRGAPLQACPQLDGMFTGEGEAGRAARLLGRHLARALMQAPLGHPPFRHSFNGHSSTLLLARSGRAHLLLQAREPGRQRYDHVSFSDALRFEAVLAGAGRATVVRRCEAAGRDAALYEERIALAAGARLALDCNSEALLVEHVATRLVCLRLHRTAAEPRPTAEHDRATGRMVHQACGDLRTSREEMMVALLGRMNRAESAPLLAEIAREPGEPSLRWQALRESLSLDTAQGFGALCAIARRTGDPLAADAGALRAQLVEAYPQLRDLETSQCPA